MLEKIIDKKVDPKVTVPQVQKRIAKSLINLKKKYASGGSQVEYHWDHSKRKLLMKSRYFSGEIDLFPGGLSVWVDLPFLFRPFKGKIVGEVTKEVNSLLKD